MCGFWHYKEVKHELSQLEREDWKPLICDVTER